MNNHKVIKYKLKSCSLLLLLLVLSQNTYVWAPLMLQGGWTVADTARPERITTMRNSNNSCETKIELNTPANANRTRRPGNVYE